MRKILWCLLLLFAALRADAQISGSDTVCAGYIYGYTVEIPGAATYQWTLPQGWYVISGQGTDSVVVACNDSVGSLQVTGFFPSGTPVDTFQLVVTWGINDGGWSVDADLEPSYACGWMVTLSVVTCCGGGGTGCGSGIPNPDVVFAAYQCDFGGPDFQFFLGIVDDAQTIEVSGYGTSICVYQIDTAAGLQNAVLVQGGDGSGTINNTYTTPVIPNPVEVQLSQSPLSVCVGDTFELFADCFCDAPYMEFTSPNQNVTLGVEATPVSTHYYGILSDTGGTVIINFSGANGFGCSVFGSTELQYHTCLPTAAISSDEIAMCLDTIDGNCVYLENSSVDANLFEWYFPGALYTDLEFGSEYATACYDSAGYYDVILIAHQGPFSDTLIKPDFIHICGNPTITVQSDTMWILPAAEFYQWEFNGQIISGATSQFYVSSIAGLYQANVWQCECVKNVSFNFTSLVLDYIKTDAGCVSGGGIVVNPSGGTVPYTILWNTGETTASITDLPPGTYTVTVTDSAGAAKVKIIEILLNDFVVELTPSDTIVSCFNAFHATITVTAFPDMNYTFYAGGSDSILQSGSNNTFQPNLSGTHSYWSIVTDSTTGCADTTNAVTVILNELPSPSIIDNGCENHVVFLETAPVDSSYTYSWWRNGSEIIGANGVSFNAAISGSYVVVVADSCGVSKQSVPLVIDTTCFTALASLSETIFDIYPNPNNGTFMLLLPVNTSALLEISNVTGSIVYRKRINSNGNSHLPVDIRSLSLNGIYAIRLTAPQSTVVRTLVIKR